MSFNSTIKTVNSILMAQSVEFLILGVPDRTGCDSDHFWGERG